MMRNKIIFFSGFGVTLLGATGLLVRDVEKVKNIRKPLMIISAILSVLGLTAMVYAADDELLPEDIIEEEETSEE